MTSRLLLAVSLFLGFTTTAPIARAEDPPQDWPRVDVSVSKVVGLPKLEMSTDRGWTRNPCVLPCAARLDPALVYRVSGDGVVDSDPFRLPAGADQVRVDVVPGSTMLRDMGTFLAIGGLVFVAGGGSVLLLPAGSATSDEKTNKTITGVGLLAAGVIATTIGMLVRLVSDTSVSVSPTAPATSAAGSP